MLHQLTFWYNSMSMVAFGSDVSNGSVVDGMNLFEGSSSSMDRSVIQCWRYGAILLRENKLLLDNDLKYFFECEFWHSAVQPNF